MKKNKLLSCRLTEIIIIALIFTMVGMVSGGVAVFSVIGSNEKQVYNIEKDLEGFSNVYQQIVDMYFEEIDRQKLLEGAIKGMLSTLDDPNSSFIDFEGRSSFDDRMMGQYRGVGMEIMSDSEGNIYVVGTFDNSPAQRKGIKSGDMIISVDDVIVKSVEIENVANLIKSPLSDTVEIKILRDKKEIELTIEKEIVIINSVISNTYIRDDKKIGYLQISIFAANTYSQFKEALIELEKQNISGLVIDVRSNSGGYLSSVANMLELFLEEDITLYKVETKEKITEKFSSTGEHRDYPIAVLINQQSASASEILAASLNENYGAELVGTKTYGKGTVQQLIEIPGGGIAKITIQKWLTPSGNYIDEVGVEPTIEVDLGEEYLKNPIDINDLQLQTAIDQLIK